MGWLEGDEAAAGRMGARLAMGRRLLAEAQLGSSAGLGSAQEVDAAAAAVVRGAQSEAHPAAALVVGKPGSMMWNQLVHPVRKAQRKSRLHLCSEFRAQAKLDAEKGHACSRAAHCAKQTQKPG